MSPRPSRRHELLTRSLPRLREIRTVDPRDPAAVAAERQRLEQGDAVREPSLPTTLTPGLARRYRVVQEHVDGPGDGFATWVLSPQGSAVSGTVYYLHGGGFVQPMEAAHVRYATRLGRASRARVVLPDYPLAPGHTWRDSHEALADDIMRYAARGPVVLAGDSAGGNLALSLAATLRDRAGSQPVRLVLVSPWVDLSESTPATAPLDEQDPWLDLGALRTYAGFWAGSEDPAELARPELSPALGDLDGLPPALMFCGTRDLLQPGCRMLADRARGASWSLTYVEQRGLIHVYPLLPGVPEAHRARLQVEAFLR